MHLSSRAFYELEINEHFLLLNNNFSEIFPSAFSMKTVSRFDMQNNRIDRLDGEGFHFSVKERVNIQSNFIKGFSTLSFSGEFTTNVHWIQLQQPSLPFSSDCERRLQITQQRPVRINIRIKHHSNNRFAGLHQIIARFSATFHNDLLARLDLM